MQVFTTDRFTFPLPAGHFFPLAKYRLLRERVEAFGLRTREAPEATDDELRTVHEARYVAEFRRGTLPAAELRRIGLPWSPELVTRSLRSAGATIAASRAARDDGYAVYLGGGTHHAHAAQGNGYCVFNDAAIAARLAQREGAAARVLIVDGDAHQGDGTAAIFAVDPSVFTLSIHAAEGYPRTKPPSDLDVALPTGTGDDDYLAALRRALEVAFAASEPELVVYLAGADPHHDDRIGKLALTTHGLAARDAMVFDACDAHGVPVVVTMAGGYGRDVETVVAVHLATVREADERWRRRRDAVPGDQ